LRDILAYVRGTASDTGSEAELLTASQDRGWSVLRSNGCLWCHVVNGYGGGTAPELVPGKQPALTMIQFGALMWNHSPEMRTNAQARGMVRPVLQDQQIADVVAFLAGLRASEPAGSPQIGRTVFQQTGCGDCHGMDAQGTQ
jgi:cytochrome c553